MNPPQRPTPPLSSSSTTSQTANTTVSATMLSSSPQSHLFSPSPSPFATSPVPPIHTLPVSASLQPNSTFKRHVWSGTIPICVSIDASELPSGSDQTINATYLVVPRISYLPLIVPQVYSNLLELVLDPVTLGTINENDLWFEFQGQPLRWHWPIGLLYDYHTSNPALSLIRSEKTEPFRSNGLGELRLEPLPNSHSASPIATDTADPNANPLVSGPQRSLAPASHQPPRLPWHIKVRLTKPPIDKLHSNSGLDSCKTSFMSMIKEADFVRYGSTKKVVNLRKQEQDALWEGVIKYDFDMYWTVAQKLVPNMVAMTNPEAASRDSSIRMAGSRAPSLNMTLDERAPSLVRSFTSQTNESQASLAPSTVSAMTGTSTSETPSLTSGGSGTTSPSGNSNNLRSIPIRIFLPEHAPIVQEPVSPILEDGRPATLLTLLSSLFPLLFPPLPSFSSFQSASPPLAYAVIQGIRMPLDAEIGWLGSCMISPDGWLAIVIGLLGPGEIS